MGGASSCKCHLQEQSNATLRVDALYRNCTECTVSHRTRNVGRMYLHGQDIVEIKRMAFYGLNSVKELHLTNNSLTRLEKGTFDRRYLPNLKEISIGGNPIELWHANVTL